MKYTQSASRYLLRLEKGEEAIETITRFCTAENIHGGLITAIGAFDLLQAGFYDTLAKAYINKEFSGGFEVAPLTGNISLREGKVFLHLHVNFAAEDMIARAGHLFMGRVNPTLEVWIDAFPHTIRRTFDPETGLYLLNL